MWNAHNSTVSSETIMNGKRVVTITPSSSASNGSSISVNATITFNGGCTYTTPSKYLKVYEAETPPTPSGYIYMEPINGDACDNDGYEVIFVPYNPYSNGKTSLSRTILPPLAGMGPQSITVCYTNFCSMEQSCKTFTAYPPSPCGGDGGGIKPTLRNTVLAPNPSLGMVSIRLDQPYIGEYHLYNNNGAVVQQDSFKGQEIIIHFDPKLKNGNYFLKIHSEGVDFTKQIILNR